MPLIEMTNDETDACGATGDLYTGNDYTDHDSEENTLWPI